MFLELVDQVKVSGRLVIMFVRWGVFLFFAILLMACAFYFWPKSADAVATAQATMDEIPEPGTYYLERVQGAIDPTVKYLEVDLEEVTARYNCGQPRLLSTTKVAGEVHGMVGCFAGGKVIKRLTLILEWVRDEQGWVVKDAK